MSTKEDLLTTISISPFPHLHHRIEPSNGFVSLRIGELWAYRELLYFLIWRDIKVRYKQTALGVAWAVIQPVMTMVVFSVFFGKLAKMPSDDVPYPIFAFAALVPWTLFSNGLTLGTNSLVGSSHLIKKVYFPRLIIPTATVLAGVVDFLVALGVLFILMAVYGIAPTVDTLWLPAFLVLTLISSLGVSLWLSALNVGYRDIKYVIPFLTQIWMFATPIAYSSSLLNETWRTFYGINPMVGVVEGFRWALLGTDTKPGFMILVSAIAAVSLLLSGAFYFRRMEKTFADIV
ncbi:MAG: ABC transporter permease [Acidobacteria bacterium]|nr:ABC transporter permease [Acidobacteriota bacterium]